MSRQSRRRGNCFLLDNVKSSAEPKVELRSKQVFQARLPSPDGSEEDSSRQGQSVSSSQEEQHWEKLDYTGLISDYLYGDFVPTTFGTTLESAIEAVDTKLQELDSGKVAGDNYAAEMKLYNKGVKERQQKADAERIERDNHKEEYERMLRELEYKNRNKKKRSAVDIEFDEFLTRPFKFTSARVSTRKSKNCSLGKECGLCKPDEQYPETDIAGGFIEVPSFHAEAIKDLLRNVGEAELEEANQGGNKRAPPSRALRGRSINTTTRSVLMLHEMKHSLRFLRSYNEGYFKRERS